MKVDEFNTNKNRRVLFRSIGRVKNTKIGLINTLSIDNIKLAIKAVPKPSSWKLSKNCATIIKATAFKKIDRNQRKNINIPYPFSKLSNNRFKCTCRKNILSLH